ncbi:MAG: BON domain-containing protein [Chitinophagaceae bacterium]
MKQKLARMLLLFGAIALISSTTPGCKSKPKDADIKTAVEAAIAANPDLTGLMVDVKDGIATLTGEVKDAAAQAAAQTAVAAVKGVKSVQNNVSVAPPPPPPVPVEITADDPLASAVKDATKDFPTVTATVKDGVISVSGELKSDAWKKLKMALDGLKPKKVDASGLKIAKK